jgi:hypothetical protein
VAPVERNVWASTKDRIVCVKAFTLVVPVIKSSVLIGGLHYPTTSVKAITLAACLRKRTV